MKPEIIYTVMIGFAVVGSRKDMKKAYELIVDSSPSSLAVPGYTAIQQKVRNSGHWFKVSSDLNVVLSVHANVLK